MLPDSDTTENLLAIIGLFSFFFGLETTQVEREFFRDLSRLVGRRAARLAACGIGAIVTKMGYLEEGCNVGADGSLYNVSLSNAQSLAAANWWSWVRQKYPGFAENIHKGLVDIFGEKGK